MAEILVVGSKVRKAVKKFKMNMAGDFIKGLSKEVEELIKKAVARTKANKRKTLKAYDF